MPITKFALLFKIFLTFLWFIPLLLFPGNWLESFGMMCISAFLTGTVAALLIAGLVFEAKTSKKN